jgi:hypothetical protein
MPFTFNHPVEGMPAKSAQSMSRLRLSETFRLVCSGIPYNGKIDTVASEFGF